MYSFIVEEEADYHNVTVYTFDQTPGMPNTQVDNEKMILTSEKLDKSDVLAENLKGLKINDAEYYESNSANMNDAKGDPTSDPKVDNPNSVRKKRKFINTSNRDLQQNY